MFESFGAPSNYNRQGPRGGFLFFNGEEPLSAFLDALQSTPMGL